jgi:diguanylate cyclase (GGDEF)-like protein
MRTTIVGMTWIYAFPFSCILPFFFDKLYWVVITYISFFGINLLEINKNKEYYFSSAKTITEIEQRIACLVLVFAFLTVISYLLSRYNEVVKDIYREASIDSITGLHTEDYIEEKLKPMILRNKNLSYTLVMVNIDKFHRFNENYGHSFGDSVLEIVGNIITEEFKDIKANASLCRIYGDKFIIIVANRAYDEVRPNYTSVKKHMNNIVLKKGNSEIFINATVSVTDTRFCEHTFESLFRRARFLQDVARQEGANKIIEDTMDL